MSNAHDPRSAPAAYSPAVWPPGRSVPQRMPPKLPLSQRQRLSAQLAGGATFLFIGGGVTVLVVTVFGVVLTLFYVGAWQLAVGAGEEFVETTETLLWHGTVVVGRCLLACGLGYGASLLALRLGRVRQTNLTTLLGAGIASVAWSIMAGIFAIAYFWIGNARLPLAGSPDAASQFQTVLIIGMAIASGVIVGSLSWWLAAHLLRSAAGGARTP